VFERNIMKYYRIFLFWSLLLGGTNTVFAEDSVIIQVIAQPDVQWQFQRLQVYTVEGRTRVSGRITANQSSGLPSGHVDLTAFNSFGERIAETSVSYSPSLMTTRIKQRGGLRFSATFDRLLPKGSVIKVAFHSKPPSNTPPPHQFNIAE
jgi:hypothetical protein